MIKLGAEADVKEIAARLRNSRRPITIQAKIYYTILGIRICKLARSEETFDPRTAQGIMDAWAKLELYTGEQLTVWTD